MPDEIKSTFDGMPANPARCLECAYVLEGLESSRCPECGRPFNLNDAKSYSRKPPLMRWRLWWPGLILALGSGVTVFGALLISGEIGIAVTFATPVAIGVLLGYRCRVGIVVLLALALSVLVGVIVMIMTLSLSGMLCSVMMLAIAVAPTLLGALLGLALRQHLKRSGFDQRAYLPVLLCIATPLAWGAIEYRWPATSPPRKVHTSIVLDMPVEQAWRRMRFYEELTHEPPFLFKIGAPRPIETIQPSTSDDRYVCVYEKGHVIKRMTRTDYLELSEFEIVEQQIGFERSVRLMGGSFAFSPIDENRTRVTLTTEYVPKLHPRWCWRPFEDHVVHTLHDYILEGMALERGESHTVAMGLAR